MSDFYIIDMRPVWRSKPYITVWRPDNAGYAFPLVWGGKYDKATVDAKPTYYAGRSIKKDGTHGKAWQRFPVPCEVVEALAIAKPAPRMIDGDTGPVLVNDKATRDALRRAKYLPPIKGAPHG